MPKRPPFASGSAQIWRARSKSGCGTDSVAPIGRCSRMSGVRVINTTRECREWCAANLRVDLGFQPTSEEWPLTEHSIRDWTGVERRRDASDCGWLTRLRLAHADETGAACRIIGLAACTRAIPKVPTRCDCDSPVTPIATMRSPCVRPINCVPSCGFARCQRSSTFFDAGCEIEEASSGSVSRGCAPWARTFSKSTSTSRPIHCS